MMSGPEFGTLRKPVTFGRKSAINIGARNAFSNEYAASSPCLAFGILRNGILRNGILRKGNFGNGSLGKFMCLI
jgi:hypothetical protein